MAGETEAPIFWTPFLQQQLGNDFRRPPIRAAVGVRDRFIFVLRQPADSLVETRLLHVMGQESLKAYWPGSGSGGASLVARASAGMLLPCEGEGAPGGSGVVAPAGALRPRSRVMARPGPCLYGGVGVEEGWDDEGLRRRRALCGALHPKSDAD